MLYDANHIVDTIESMGAEAVIPQRSNRIEQREYDRELYKERNIILEASMNLEHRAGKIRLVCTDVDGVLTDGSLLYGPEGGHWKRFNVRDGTGVKVLQKSGIPVAFISGLHSVATSQRAKDLGIEDCFMGDSDKVSIIKNLSAKYNAALDEIAFIGDDLIDVGALGIVGLAICPRDAVPEVQRIAHWIVPVDGGRGVLRAVAEFILCNMT